MKITIGGGDSAYEVGYMDGDGRIPYGGSLGCLPGLHLLGFGFRAG